MVVFFRNGSCWRDWLYPMDLFHLCFPYIPVPWRCTACWYRQRDIYGKARRSLRPLSRPAGRLANDSMELLALHSLGMSAMGGRGPDLLQPDPRLQPTSRLTLETQGCAVAEYRTLALKPVGLAMECTQTWASEGGCCHLDTGESINPPNCPRYSVLKIPVCLPLWMQRSSHLQFVSDPGIDAICVHQTNGAVN